MLAQANRFSQRLSASLPQSKRLRSWSLDSFSMTNPAAVAIQRLSAMGERENSRFSPCGTFGGASRALTNAFHAWGGRTKWFWSARSISACVQVESTMYSVRLALRRAAPALMRLAWRVVARMWNRSDLVNSSCVVCGMSFLSLLYAYCTHAPE